MAGVCNDNVDMGYAVITLELLCGSSCGYFVGVVEVEDDWEYRLVATDMGNRGAKNTGMVRALLSVDESVRNMTKVVSCSIFNF